MRLGPALILVLLGVSPVASLAAQSQSPPVFAAQVGNVYVDAFVSNRRESVMGLVASDFELKDNGVPQSVDLLSTEALPLLAVLVFDSSGSLAGKRLEALKEAGRAFLETLRPEDEASLITFAGDTQWRVRPTTDKSQVTREIEGLTTGGATSLMDALYAAIVLPRTRSRILIVLFTDGVDNMSLLDWRQMRLVAERSNALIHAVGLRRTQDEGGAVLLDLSGRMLPSADTPAVEPAHTFGLRQIAEATGGRYWEAESPARLKTAFSAVAETMAQRYVLSYEPQGVKRAGWHEIELRLRDRPGEVHARRGYWVPR